MLGAMETMYQRSKIQEESMYYESLKHSGQLPVIGVNTFLSSKGSPTVVPGEVIRATEEEKLLQLQTLQNLHKTWGDEATKTLDALKKAAAAGENIFDVLMETTKYASLEQITQSLFAIGGQYRRNM